MPRGRADNGCDQPHQGVVAGGAAYAALLRLTRRAAIGEHAALLLSGVGCAAAAALLALLAGRA